MKIHRSHKIELKPNNVQCGYFRRACGIARFVFNWGLAEWKQQYEADEKPSKFKLKKEFNAIKHDAFPFVTEVTKCAAECAFDRLGTAFKNFFRNIKAGNKPGYPQFKRKGKCKDSFYLANNQFSINRNKIRIPLLGWVRMRECLRYSGKILSATISRTAEKWFVSISVEIDIDEPANRETQALVGIDVGLNSFAILSTGESFTAPKPLKHALKKLRQLNKKLSRQIKGSNNREKTKQKLAKLYYHISCVRNDFTHKLSTVLLKCFSGIAIEDLNIKGMIRNRNLSKSISDVAWSEFRRQLEYKAEAFGSKVIAINQWFPSTQQCSQCCSLKDGDEKLKLGNETYRCDHCGSVMDRDLNAAINIRNEGFNLSPYSFAAGLAVSLESSSQLNDSSDEPVVLVVTAKDVHPSDTSLIKHHWAGSFHEPNDTMMVQSIQ